MYHLLITAPVCVAITEMNSSARHIDNSIAMLDQCSQLCDLAICTKI